MTIVLSLLIHAYFAMEVPTYCDEIKLKLIKDNKVRFVFCVCMW